MKNRVDCELKKNPHESETEKLRRVAARKRSASISVHALAKECTSLAGIQDGGRCTREWPASDRPLHHL